MENFEQHLEGFEETIKKLAKTYEIYPLEWQDIAQELRIHLFNKYNSKVKEFDKWAYITCRNKIRDIAKYHQRKKRGKKPSSLNEMIDNGFEI